MTAAASYLPLTSIRASFFVGVQARLTSPRRWQSTSHYRCVSIDEARLDLKKSMSIRIAIIGGGISGAALFHSLYESFGNTNDEADAVIQCDLYDQGRAFGGRTSTRFANDKVPYISFHLS